ncbi:MAG TPA: DUF222 domain-containing protein [Mycobacteriales bacterium]|nr:DUF222 domain-containing protein [Mycobacteriales bacterium]
MFDHDSHIHEGRAIAAGVLSSEDDYYERLAAFDSLIDEVELSAAEVDANLLPAEPWAEVGFEAWLEELVAADPDRPRDPAAVVGDGESMPVTPGLICELVGVDSSRLDESARIGLAVAWSRVENWAAAQKLVAISDVAGPEPEPNQTLADGAFAWAEVGAALRLGDGEATGLVHAVRHLHTHLPETLATMSTGEMSWRKVRTLVDRTASLTAAQCAEVEARILAKAGGRTPAQHDAAVRRAVDRIDPAAAEDRRKQRMSDIALVRAHYGDGMGEVFARMPSEDVETVWLAADGWARRTKEAGDSRALDQLRVAALVTWANSFLTHGHPTTCDLYCGHTHFVEQQGVEQQGQDAKAFPADGPAEETGGTEQARKADASTPAGSPLPSLIDRDQPPAAPDPHRDTPPRRHGRPLTINITIDLPTFLGLTDHQGELLGPGVLIPAQAIRDLLPDAALRRLVIDPMSGHLLDASPEAIRPSAALAGFCALRDVTATTPTAGPTSTSGAAGAGDLDHIIARADGGPTTRRNLHSPTRRWHRAKTHAGWTVIANDDRTWTWTSPTGRTYRTQPHDYRLGP